MTDKADRLAGSAALFEQRCDPFGYRNRRIGRTGRQFEMSRRAGRVFDRDEIGKGTADIDPDPDHRSSSRRAWAVRPPAAANGLWISTPLSTAPSVRSSVKINVQPASAAVATNKASQYDARPATELARAARTASAEAAAQGNA